LEDPMTEMIRVAAEKPLQTSATVSTDEIESNSAPSRIE
jgi:hypothetical protein